MRSSFITWYPYCRRSDAIAAALKGPSHLIHSLTFRNPVQAPLRYLLQWRNTARTLRREQPDVTLVAVPPIFAALPVWNHARRTGTRFVVDAHTGIFDHTRWTWLLPLTRRVFRAAEAVVVTNEHLAEVVRSWDAKAVIIGDVPVTFEPGKAPEPVDGPRIVVINTFSVDEPVDELLAAARQLPHARFFVTGDTRHAKPAWLSDKPDNVTFTGFVSEEDYSGLLGASDAVVVLTTHDHTMQRGAYEAMALGKPLVTSDWGILRDTFSRGTQHVSNTADAIAEGVRSALSDSERLGDEMRSLREERRGIFETNLAELVRITRPEPATSGKTAAAGSRL